MYAILEREGDNWGPDRWGRLLRSTEVGLMGRGDREEREEFAEETDPRVLEVYNFDSLGLNKEGFQKNEQTL